MYWDFNYSHATLGVPCTLSGVPPTFSPISRCHARASISHHRHATLELQQQTQRRQHEEENWYRQQKLLHEAEQRRRKLIADQEQKLIDQRTRLAAMNRELKMKELGLMDATRRKVLEYQRQQKEMELARMDDEIRRKVRVVFACGVHVHVLVHVAT